MSKQNAIEVHNLTKKYKGKAEPALDNISMNIPYGSIFGLLGPNGAGKSSFINILGGLTLKSEGEVKICGIDIDKDPKSARGAIGVVPQEINIDPFFSPIEVLDFQAGLYGVTRSQMNNLEILKKVNLDEKANAYSRSLSGGMKRRLMVAKAMVHNPPVLVLDEPTAGVDVELRKKLWLFIKTLNKKGVTIILTTHYLEEAQSLCDYIAIINNGKLIKCESKNTLMSMIDEKEINIKLSKNVKILPKTIKKYVKEHSNNMVTLKYDRNKINTGKLIQLILKSKINIEELSTKDPDLEEIFLELIKT